MTEESDDRILYQDDWLRLELFPDQFLPGYSILYAPMDVVDLHTLGADEQRAFLTLMARAGSAIVEASGARRMNYLIQGNQDPYLHAHIVPRFEWEQSPWREGPAAFYPEELRRPMRAERQVEGLADKIRSQLA
jgi:diadenosine tetraphosphate (Ap4A) HIT family hydrolase